MKKKYKLIKEYPRSPKKGSIVTTDNCNDMVCSYSVGDSTYEYSINLKAYPEFWEEVKNYEIVAYSQKDYVYNIDHPNWDYIKKQNYDIFSVKRESDGEVFSVGDKIKAEPFVRDRKYTVIDKIYYNEHEQLSYRTISGEAPRVFVFNKDTEHYKEPLFTTDDGVDLYSLDDTIYSVNKSQRYLTLSPRLLKREIGNVNTPKYMYNFSTKEAAEKFIYNNKPIYSKRDIMKAIEETVSEDGGGCKTHKLMTIEIFKKKLESYENNNKPS